MLISYSPVISYISCILFIWNITGRYYLLISALDKFCHLKSLWVNGIWYVSSECFLTDPFYMVILCHSYLLYLCYNSPMLKVFICSIFCWHLSRIMFRYCSKYEHTKDTLILYKIAWICITFEKIGLNALHKYSWL